MYTVAARGARTADAAGYYMALARNANRQADQLEREHDGHFNDFARNNGMGSPPGPSFFETHHFERTRCVVRLWGLFRGSRFIPIPAGEPYRQLNAGAGCGLMPSQPDPRQMM